MSDLKKYVADINKLIEKYKSASQTSVIRSHTEHLESVLMRLENEINNVISFEEGSVWRSSVEQSIKERYGREIENAEKTQEHVFNPSKQLDELLAETALPDITPNTSSQTQGVATTANAVYVADGNVVPGYEPSPFGKKKVAQNIAYIMTNYGLSGLGNIEIMNTIVEALYFGIPGGGDDNAVIVDEFIRVVGVLATRISFLNSLNGASRPDVIDKFIKAANGAAAALCRTSVTLVLTDALSTQTAAMANIPQYVTIVNMIKDSPEIFRRSIISALQPNIPDLDEFIKMYTHSSILDLLAYALKEHGPGGIPIFQSIATRIWALPEPLRSNVIVAVISKIELLQADVDDLVACVQGSGVEFTNIMTFAVSNVAPVVFTPKHKNLIEGFNRNVMCAEALLHSIEVNAQMRTNLINATLAANNEVVELMYLCTITKYVAIPTTPRFPTLLRELVAQLQKTRTMLTYIEADAAKATLLADASTTFDDVKELIYRAFFNIDNAGNINQAAYVYPNIIAAVVANALSLDVVMDHISRNDKKSANVLDILNLPANAATLGAVVLQNALAGVVNILVNSFRNVNAVMGGIIVGGFVYFNVVNAVIADMLMFNSVMANINLNPGKTYDFLCVLNNAANDVEMKKVVATHGNNDARNLLVKAFENVNSAGVSRSTGTVFEFDNIINSIADDHAASLISIVRYINTDAKITFSILSLLDHVGNAAILEKCASKTANAEVKQLFMKSFINVDAVGASSISPLTFKNIVENITQHPAPADNRLNDVILEIKTNNNTAELLSILSIVHSSNYNFLSQLIAHANTYPSIISLFLKAFKNVDATGAMLIGKFLYHPILIRVSGDSNILNTIFTDLHLDPAAEDRFMQNLNDFTNNNNVYAGFRLLDRLTIVAAAIAPEVIKFLGLAFVTLVAPPDPLIPFKLKYVNVIGAFNVANSNLKEVIIKIETHGTQPQHSALVQAADGINNGLGGVPLIYGNTILSKIREYINDFVNFPNLNTEKANYPTVMYGGGSKRNDTNYSAKNYQNIVAVGGAALVAGRRHILSVGSILLIVIVLLTVFLITLINDEKKNNPSGCSKIFPTNKNSQNLDI